MRKFEQLNKELINAMLKKTTCSRCEDMGSKTEPFYEIASLNDQVLPTTKISREVGQSTNESYPLVSGSNSSVYAIDPIVKENKQANKIYIEEAGD